MNQQQASEKGYIFEGTYSSYNKEKVKAVAKQLRENGNKAVVVDCPTSKYSRAPSGMGYSVYWIESVENKAIKAKKALETKRIRLQFDFVKAQNELAEIVEKLKEVENQLKETI